MSSTLPRSAGGEPESRGAKKKKRMKVKEGGGRSTSGRKGNKQVIKKTAERYSAETEKGSVMFCSVVRSIHAVVYVLLGRNTTTSTLT